MSAVASGGQPLSWLHDLFRAVDARDTARFLRFLTDDASFRFGNLPVCRGKRDIGRAVDTFFEGIAGCRHEIAENWQVSTVVICHGTVTYERHDRSRLTVPFANILALRGDYLIFADITPLYAQARG